MKKISLMAIAFATVLLSVTSCEEVNSDITNDVSIEDSRAPLSADLPSSKTASAKTLTGKLPTSIQELKDEGFSVSDGLASFIGNRLDVLLRAATLSVSDPDLLRRFGFFESEIEELIIINSQYNDLVTLFNIDANSFKTVPSTIAEARAAGIPISQSVAKLGNLQSLLSNPLTSNELSNADIGELRRLQKLFTEIKNAVPDANTTPEPEPTPVPEAPVVTPTPEPQPTPEPEPTPPTTAELTVAQQVLDLVNGERTQRGLNPLVLNNALNTAAFNHSKDMNDNNYFSHTGQDGSSFGQRVGRTNYTGFARAENIAGGQTTAQQVHNAWMNSTGHRDNILLPDVTDMGLGKSGTIWTQIFGRN